VVDGVETEGVFRAEIAQEEQAHARHGWSEAIRHEERLFQKLLGTAATWFLFDVLFYGNTLFQPIVIEAAFGAREHSNPLHLLQRTAVNSLILTSIALPGYAVAGLVMGKRTWGIVQTPRFVMLQGFAAMSVLYLIIGIYWKDLRHYPLLLVFLYGSTFFFANYGPNTTTFVLPSLVYSEECRSTLNGISAAAGKFGALVGATLFAPAADSFGDAAIMLICSFIAVLAFMMTTFFVRLRVEHTSDGVV
jgi:PHS family inorganic phosphate transporter-like MFS transporter